MTATSVMPGIARTSAVLSTPSARPLIVGGLQTIVGSAPGTSRSMANFLVPVTMSRASIRRWSVPTIECCVFRRGVTATDLVTAAFSASDPNVAVRPSAVVNTPSRRRRSHVDTLSSSAAACISRPRAVAAAMRTGVKMECMVFEPPVNWLNRSSGRASASVTVTLSSGTSISSAMVIATAVVMPWPTSARGSANDTVPSALTVTLMRLAVGSVAAVSTSLRSSALVTWTVGIAAVASAASQCAAATSVGAASR
jgi:hypothetical protein